MQSAPTPHIREAIKVAGSKRGEVLWSTSQGAGVSKRGAKLKEMGISDAQEACLCK